MSLTPYPIMSNIAFQTPVSCIFRIQPSMNPDVHVTGLHVRTEPVALGTETTFNMDINTGTNVLIFIDYGDNATFELVWFADRTRFQPLTITYNESGTYYTHFWAHSSNEVSSYSIIAQVEIKLQGTIDISKKNLTLGKDLNTTIIPQVNSGSHYTVSIMPRFCPITTKFYASPPSPYDKIYVDFRSPGVFTTEVRITNIISIIDYSYEVRVGIPFQSISLKSTGPARPGSVVTFNVSMEHADVNCVFNFDNGFYTVVFEEYVLDDISVEMNYTTAKIYIVEVLCANAFNSSTAQLAVVVQDRIPSVEFTEVGPVVYVSKTGTLALHFSASNGTDIQFIGLCGTTACGSIGGLNGKTGNWTIRAPDLTTKDQDEVTVTLVATNLVSSVNASISVSIDTPITGCKFDDGTTHFKFGVTYDQSLSCEEGTRITFLLDNGGGSTLVAEVSDQLAETGSLSISTVGCVTQNFTGANRISASTATRLICIEHPLPTADSVTYEYSNISDLGEVSFTFKLDVDSKIPTDVTANWNFGDSNTESAMVSFIEQDGQAIITSSHQYEAFGVFTVTCNLHNNVSDLYLVVNVSVGEPIVGLSLVPDVARGVVGTPTTFNVHVDKGSRVTFTLNFGDGHSSSCNRETGPWDRAMDMKIDHTYSSPDDTYLAEIRAVNEFGTVGPIEADGTMMILYRVPSLSLSTRSPSNSEPVGDVAFTVVQLSAASHVPSLPVSCAWTSDFAEDAVNRQIDRIVDGTFRAKYTGHVTKTGEHQLDVNCSNAASWNSTTITFTIRGIVVGLDVKTTDATVRVPVSINVSLSQGSSVNISINFGDDSPDFEQQLDTSNAVDVVHRFSAVGEYQINVTVRNEVSSLWQKVMINVTSPLPPILTLETNSPVELILGRPPARVHFRIPIKTSKRVPLVSVISADYGDGKGMQPSTGHSLIDDVTWYYDYSKPEFYDVQVSIKAIEDVRTFQELVVVAVRLSEITIAVAPPGEDKSTKREFAAGTPLQFVAEHEQGTGAQYNWTITDTEDNVVHNEVTSSSDMLYTLSDEGSYYVSVVADNGIANDEPGFPKAATTDVTMSETGIISELIYETEAVVGQYRFYSVQISDHYQKYVGTICMRFVLGDDTVWISSMLRYCLNVDPEVDELKYETPGSSEMLGVRYKFDKKGTKIIEATAMIETGKKFTIRGKVEVTGFCYRPVITRLALYAEMAYRRQDKIGISRKAFSVKLNCSEGGVNATYLLTNEQGEDVSNAMRVIGGAVNIAAFTLAYGLYNLRYEVTMHSAPTLTGSSRLQLEIVQSDIEVAFENGIYQMVSLNEKVELAVDVNNPDFPGERDKDVGLLWFCHQEGEAELNDPPMIEVPTDYSQYKLGLGGCFNGGPGQLNVTPTEYNLTLDTTFMFSGKAYVITVRATRKGKMIDTIQKTIEIFKGKILPMEIRCVANCGDKINRDRGVFLNVLCDECTPDSIFEWSTTSSISLDSGLSRELHIGSEKLVEGLVVAVQVNVRSRIGEGKAKYEFGVNYAPRPGYCTSDVSEGDISTTFHLSCHDWEDDGWNKIDGTGFKKQDSAVMIYSYAYFDKFGNEHSLAGNNVQLPSGDPDKDYAVKMKGYVTDQYGAKSDISFTVRVKPVDNPYFLRDMTDQLAGGDMSTTMVNLESHLDTLNVVATEVLGMLNIDEAEEETTSVLEKPASNPEEQKSQEQDNARLQILDKAVDLFANIITSDVELSPVQTASLASSLSSVRLPKTALPNTMNTMLNSADSLANSISDQLLGEDQSPAEIESLTKSVAGIANNVAKAAQEKLVQPAITDQDLDTAALDVPMTEDEEKRMREKMKQKEEEFAKLRSKILSSTIKISQQIGVGMGKSDQPIIELHTDTMSITRKKIDPRVNIGPPQVSVIDSKNTSSTALFMDTQSSQDLEVQVSAFDRSIFGISKNSTVGNTIVMVNVFVADETISDTSTHLMLTQEQVKPEDIPGNETTDSNVDSDTGMVYFAVNVQKKSAFSMNLAPDNTNDAATVDVFIRINCTDVVSCRPSRTKYDYMSSLPQTSKASPWQFTMNDVEGELYIGIDAKAKKKRTKRGVVDVNQTYVPVLTVTTGISSCSMYDEETKMWTDGNGTLSENTVLGSPQCIFMPQEGRKAFSSGFKVPTINPINFNKIFAHFAELLGDNNTVFITVFLILGVYIILAILARRYDRRDVEKWGVLPLQDNPKKATNFYKISVYTGLRNRAGTKSNIMFILTGDDADTGVRLLRDMKSRDFSRGSVRQFVLSTQYSLGALTFLRIWHDNGGKGDTASWFLDKIVVEDYQTGNKYYFLCGEWLAIDEGDGLINRILPVAGRDEITGFGHLFFDNTRRKLFDDHLWLSVISRPMRSNFTRLQRLTCIVCLLSTTMVSNAMWYGRAKITNDRVIKVGPITLSGATLLVSLFGSLTVIPVNTLILMLFRKHRPKDWPSDEALIDEMSGDADDRGKPELEEKKKKKKWWKGKYPLPYWCAYIGWTLAILFTLTSMMFIIFYSLDWGREKSNEWFSALFISVIQSVLLFQPIKVILFAMVIALIFKTVADDDEEVCERENNAKPASNEEIVDEDLDALRQLTVYRPPDALSDEKLREAREKRSREKRMWSAMKDAVFYFFFLVLLCLIVWGSKDELAYVNNRMLANHLAGGSLETFQKTVTDGHAFWYWARNVLVERLFYIQNYNGQPGTPRERQFLSDGVSYRVGPLVMRQVRVKQADKQPPVNTGINIPSDGLYNIMDEEDRDFGLEWQLDQRTNYTDDGELTRIQKAFRYRSFTDLKGIPLIGKLGTYGGGGYVANLGSSKGQALELMDQLVENGWLDRDTRAIFVEFNSYNPNTNYFSHISYLLESPAIGALLPQSRVESFQLYIRLSGMNVFLVACEILYIIIIIVFMVREVMQFRNSKGNYWKDPLNYIELAVIVLSWAALAMYLMKEIIGRLVLSDLAKNKDKYMNFKLFAYYEELQWDVIGFIVFMADVKFLRILRFNHHVVHFARTLKHAAPSLVSFGVMFSVLFMAFTSSGYFLFSKEMSDFKTVISVMESLYSMLIGKFDVHQMEETDRILGPVYFATFMVVIYIVIVNIFLGILESSYKEVTLMMVQQRDDSKIFACFTEKMTQYLHLTKTEKKETLQYMDNYDSLNQRLDSLDRLLTDECRAILNNRDKERASDSKMRKLDFLTKLQIHHSEG